MMTIYALIAPDQDWNRCIHTFSAERLAERAKEIYGLDGSMIVQLQLDATEDSIGRWRNSGEPELFILCDERLPRFGGQAFIDRDAYEEAKATYFANHPWKYGVLDEMRHSVEQGFKLFRVMMRANKELVRITSVMDMNSTEVFHANRSISIGPDTMSFEVKKGLNDKDGPYLVHVYANNEAHALDVATPLLHRRIEQDAMHPAML